MIRVLYLQSTSEIGGSDISLLRLVEKLDKKKFEPHVLLPAAGPLCGALEARGCKVHLMPAMLKLTTRKGPFYLAVYALNYLFAVWKIRGLIKKHDISLVHTNNLHNHYGFAAAKLAGRPHVWHIREIVFQSGWFMRLEIFLAVHFGGELIVTSNSVGAMFRGKDGRMPKNLSQIPNGVDLEEFHPRNSGDLIFRDLGLDPRTPVAGMACRLDPWKGVDVFLRAAAICRKSFPSARFIVAGGAIAGREAYAGEVKKLAADLGIEDAVIFTDWKYGPERMPELHAAFTVLVLASSEPEPFGLVIIEAMATGRPVVATNHGGPGEICISGETGYLVAPHDAYGMAEAMLRIFKDPARAQAMGKAGRRRAELYYGRETQVRKIENLYEIVINKC